MQPQTSHDWAPPQTSTPTPQRKKPLSAGCGCLLITLGLIVFGGVVFGIAKLNRADHADTLFKKAYKAHGKLKYKEALDLYQRACDRHLPEACSRAALMYENGLGVPKDPAKAVKLYDLACSKNASGACHTMGEAHRLGKFGLAKDLKKAISAFERGCEGTSGKSCFEAGRLHEQRKDTSQKAATFYTLGCQRDHGPSCTKKASTTQGRVGAFTMYEKACRLGDKEGCYQQALLIVVNSPQREMLAKTHFKKACGMNHAEACEQAARLYGKSAYSEAIPKAVQTYYQKACNLGLGQACYTAGMMYTHGDQGTKDPTYGTSLFKTGCKAKHVGSCRRYGQHLEQGVGIKKDPAGAVDAYQRGCDLKGSISCQRLATALARGEHVPRDDAKAHAIFQKACEQLKDGKSCHELASRHQAKGKDHLPRALKYFALSCDYNHMEGCHQAGLMYKRGKGVKKNRAKARAFFKTACRHKHKPSCRQR